MNIYRINIWGPCQSEGTVLARQADTPDNSAIVVAASKDVANQLCYLVATRDAHGQSNYQEIDSFTSPVACILDTAQDPSAFEPDLVDDLIANPILPAASFPDTQIVAGALFFARCIDSTGKTRGQYWVYAPDATSANVVVTEHGETIGLFNLDSEAIRVELYPLEKACVFWNVMMTMYKLHNNAAEGDA